jgi:Pilus formation protein N terminal region
MSNLLRFSASILALGFLLATHATAAEKIVISTDQTQLISVSGNPGTVVVGNPSIADATVHGDKVFIHGRAFGSTNMIILDQNGAELASMEITVKIGGSNNVAVFKGGFRYSYVCAPLCETAMQPGDEFEWSGKVVGANQGKSGFAKGEASSGPASAPPPGAE